MTRLPMSILCAALISLAAPGVHADDASPAAVVQKTAKPGTVSASSVEKFTATVTAVDLAARTVTLKVKGVGEETFNVSEDVKRFCLLERPSWLSPFSGWRDRPATAASLQG